MKNKNMDILIGLPDKKWTEQNKKLAENLKKIADKSSLPCYDFNYISGYGELANNYNDIGGFGLVIGYFFSCKLNDWVLGVAEILAASASETSTELEHYYSFKRWHPLVVDFTDSSLIWRCERAQHESLIQAIKHKSKKFLRICDATAGVGTDAMLMASVGNYISLVERNSIVFSLLEDGIRRLQNVVLNTESRDYSDLLSEGLLHRLNSINYNSIEFLQEISLQKVNSYEFDVVYIDPMFEFRKRKSLPNKSMQYLGNVLSETSNGEDLSLDSEKLWFESARSCSPKVVVKRHKRAENFAKIVPSYSISSGKSCRFDVYN